MYNELMRKVEREYAVATSKGDYLTAVQVANRLELLRKYRGFLCHVPDSQELLHWSHALKEMAVHGLNTPDYEELIDFLIGELNG